MNALRNAVSGSRNRFKNGSYDLDLTYISPRLIAMGFPASGIEKTYRNDIAEVVSFLDENHPQKYLVFNLSERRYDYAKFHNRVMECGFPDHHAPTLKLLCYICKEMQNWIQQDPSNIVVVHCMAGKGRTGVIVTCFLLLSGIYGDLRQCETEKELATLVAAVIEDFSKVRGQGIGYPSQIRYVEYFAKIISSTEKTLDLHVPKLPIPEEKYLSHIILHGIPNFDAAPNGGCTPFLQIITSPTQFERPTVIFNSAWESPFVNTYGEDPKGCILMRIGRKVAGDILLRCFHVEKSQKMGRLSTEMFYMHLHTSFLTPVKEKVGVFRIKKEQIDEANCKRFPDDFFVDLVFDVPDVESSTPTTTTTSSGRNAVEVASSGRTTRFSGTRSPVTRSLGTTRNRSYGTTTTTRSSVLEKQRPESLMGWLIKQGGFVRNWKRRWFVLRDGHLSYFANATDPYPLGVIDISSTRIDTCLPHEVRAPYSSYFYFKLIPPCKDDRVYYLGASSEREMSEWIRAITREVSLTDLKEESQRTAQPLSAQQQKSSTTRLLFGDNIGHTREKPLEDVELELIQTSRGVSTLVNPQVLEEEAEIDGQGHFTSLCTRDELLALAGLKEEIFQDKQLHDEFKELAKRDRDTLFGKIVEMILESCPILLDAFSEDPDQVVKLLLAPYGDDLEA